MTVLPKENSPSNAHKHNSQIIKGLIEELSNTKQRVPHKRHSPYRSPLPCDSKPDLVILHLKTAECRVCFVDTGNKKTVMRAMVRELHGMTEAVNHE